MLCPTKCALLTFMLFSFDGRNGTSFVSLYIPAKDPIDKHRKTLASELAGADAIKSKQTRTSVQSAITSTIESKLPLFQIVKISPSDYVVLVAIT